MKIAKIVTCRLLKSRLGTCQLRGGRLHTWQATVAPRGCLTAVRGAVGAERSCRLFNGRLDYFGPIAQLGRQPTGIDRTCRLVGSLQDQSAHGEPVTLQVSTMIEHRIICAFCVFNSFW